MKKRGIMNNQSCLFCRIIKREIPAEIIFENNHCIVIKDISPKSEIHWLVIPKEHITELRTATVQQEGDLGACLLAAAAAVREKADNKPFKLIANNGREAGQHIFHLHFHVLIGKMSHSISEL